MVESDAHLSVELKNRSYAEKLNMQALWGGVLLAL